MPGAPKHLGATHYGARAALAMLAAWYIQRSETVLVIRSPLRHFVI